MINGIADATPSTALIAGVATSGLALSAYTWLVRYLEGPRSKELSLAQARQGLRRGSALGLGLFTVTIALVAMTGGYHIHGWARGGSPGGKPRRLLRPPRRGRHRSPEPRGDGLTRPCPDRRPLPASSRSPAAPPAAGRALSHAHRQADSPSAGRPKRVLCTTTTPHPGPTPCPRPRRPSTRSPAAHGSMLPLKPCSA